MIRGETGKICKYVFLRSPLLYDNYLFYWLISHAKLNQIEIFNAKGQSLGEVSYPVDVSQYSAGVYFLRLKDQKGNVVSSPFTVAGR